MLLLTGPPGSGKTGRLLSRFRASVEIGAHDVLTLVPTATLAQHRQHQLAREGVLFRPQNVVTLSRFVARFTSDAQVIATDLLHVLVEKAISEHQLPAFSKIADTPNFHTVLASTITEFDAAGHTVAEVTRAFARARISDPVAEAFLQVWAAVSREIDQRGLLTRGARFRNAAAQIRLRGLNGISTVCLDGFAALPRPELAVIEALSGQAEVIVTQPSSSHSPSVEAARTELLRMGATEQQLERELDTETKLQRVIAETIEREAEEIARRVLQAYEHGTPLRRMAVVIRNRETYGPLLETTFERFGIPARSYAGTPLHDHPCVRFLSGLMEAALTGWDHQATLEALRFSPTMGASAELDYLEVKARANYPARGLRELHQLLPHPLKTLELLERLTGGFQSARRAQRWVARISDLRALCTTRELPDHVEPRDRVVYIGHAQVLSAFSDALATAAQAFDSGKALDLAEFWTAAKITLDQTTFRIRDERREVVHLLSAQEARQWDLDVVFLCGMVEKQFPRMHPQNAFFRDSVLLQLRAQGIQLRTAQELKDEEMFLFSTAIMAARHQAVLSYPRLDARGHENLPSRFWNLLSSADEVARLVRPALCAPRVTRPTSILSNDALATLNTKLVQFSPSNLETFLKCPLQFFFKKSLGLRDFPALPADRMDFLAQGNIAHAALRRWAQTRGAVGALFDEEFHEYCVKNKVPPGYSLEVTRLSMRKSLDAFARAFSIYLTNEPRVEVELVLELDEHTRIAGRADLITQEAGGAVIYDYKFSAAQATRDRTKDPTTLQAPLYIHMQTNSTGSTPLGMLFVDLKEGEAFSLAGWHNGLTDKFIQPLTPAWVAQKMSDVTKAIAAIRAGTIAPHPLNALTCERCDYQHACRYRRAEIAVAAGVAE